MKRFFCAVLTAILILSLSSVFASAAEYEYFHEVSITPGGILLDFSNVRRVNGYYYASRDSGGIYYSSDGMSFRLLGGTENYKIITSPSVWSDKLLVYSGGKLYYLTEPSTKKLVLIEDFGADSSVNYVNGLYLALTRLNEVDRTLYYSVNGVQWYMLPYSLTRTPTNVSVSNEYDFFCIRGLNTYTFLDEQVDIKITKYDMQATPMQSGEYDKNTTAIYTAEGRRYVISLISEDETMNTYAVSSMKNQTVVKMGKDFGFCMFGEKIGVERGGAFAGFAADENLVWSQVSNEIGFCMLGEENGLEGTFFPYCASDKMYKISQSKDFHSYIPGSGIEVTVDGAYIVFDQPPVIKNSRTLVPVRAICEAIGAKVDYNAETKLITITDPMAQIMMTPGVYEAKVKYSSGEEKVFPLDCCPEILNDRTLVTARFVSEILNYNVSWDDYLKKVIIESK